MDKLIFSEGGQPIYLEDLQLLQDNSTTLSRAMMGAVLQDNEACLLDYCYPKTIVINTPDMSRDIEVPAGTVYYDGMLCSWPITKLTIVKDAPIYICLKRILSDQRTFENGQKHYCREIWSASVSDQAVGSDVSWKLDTLKTYVELLDLSMRNMKKRDTVECILMNDYVGSFTVRKLGEDYEFVLSASTTAKDWLKDGVYGKGWIGVVTAVDYRTMLGRKRTPNVTYQGKQYHIRFSESGAIVLWPDGVEDITQGTVSIPLMPLNITFKYSELTNL